MPVQNSIRLLNVRVDDVNTPETLQYIQQAITAKATMQIATVNPEFIMRAQNDAEFKTVLDCTSLNVPDGIGLLWAARLKHQSLRERVAGSDLVPLICRDAAELGWRCYFLGAANGIADEAARLMQARFSKMQIAGAYAGSPDPTQDSDIVQRIANAKADIVFVAYGAPAQDKWLARNLPRIAQFTQNGIVGIGVGGTFDFIVGKRKRAPVWMQRLSLEWLHRLTQDPSRWRRQYWLPFLIRVLLES